MSRRVWTLPGTRTKNGKPHVVQLCDAAGRDVEGAGLDGGNTFVDQLRAAIHQPGFFAAELERLARNLVVVGLVRLAEVGGIGKDARAFLLHPEQRRTGVETARESDTDFFAFGQAFQDRTHGASNRSKWQMSFAALRARISNFALTGTRLMTRWQLAADRITPPRARASAATGGIRASPTARARLRFAHPCAGSMASGRSRHSRARSPESSRGPRQRRR